MRADRVRPGEELPRRTVDIKAAAPVVVAPAAVTARRCRRGTGSGIRARTGRGSGTCPRRPGCRACRGAGSRGSAGRRTAPAAPAEAAPAAAPMPRTSRSRWIEVFEKTLQELLDKGTDKRVAEGQARRAGMIAAQEGGRRGLGLRRR